MWVGIQYTWQATDEPALVMEQPGAHPAAALSGTVCKLSCRLIEARSVSRDLFSECRGYRESFEAAPQGRQTAHRRRRLLRAWILPLKKTDMVCGRPGQCYLPECTR